MHRAEQILDAIVARLQASTTLGINSQNVFPHRTLSLAENQDELPAITVKLGESQPAEELTMLDGSIGCVREILTKAYFVGEDEPTVTSALFVLLTEIHKAINLQQKLGLSFVLKVGYGGDSEPEINTDGELCAGALQSRWLVIHWMNPSDPS